MHLLVILALMTLNSLLSKSLSSSTLVRGCELLRGASMSVESDPLMVDMQKELDEFLATSLKTTMDFLIRSPQGFHD